MDHWIDTPEALAQRLAEATGARALALDTEFIRERTYFPRLALVQLALPEGVLLIDPVALPEAPALVALLGDAAVEKRMHSASEDIEALRHHYGALPAPLFDTQIAASLCGLGMGLSYQKLVASLLGVHLEKGETRSDWLARPLSESQRHYAAEDVRHLDSAADILRERLERLGRLDWHAQDCARLLRSATTAADPNPHLGLRSAQRLDSESQARLCRLLRWRECVARAQDRPRRWLLENDLAIELAARPPVHRSEYEARLDAYPKSPRRLRGELWLELSRPLESDERDIPLATEPGQELRARVKRLQHAVAKIAVELDLPEPVLANRASLEALAQEPDRWPTALQGWRAGLLQDPLRAALA